MAAVERQAPVVGELSLCFHDVQVGQSQLRPFLAKMNGGYKSSFELNGHEGT